jgi:hypothetical protein
MAKGNPRHLLYRSWPLLLAALLSTFTGRITAQAQFRYRQVNLTELTQRADIIVQGRVIEARYEGHPDYPHVPTVAVTLEVEQVLRGAVGQHYTFREFLASARMPRGKYGYAVGERLLLFLPTPSQYGLSSPLGREQGRFHVFRDTQGNDVVANEFGNAGLFRNVEQEAAREGLSLSAKHLRVVSMRRGPAPLEDFISLVKSLTFLPRTE